MSVVSVERHPSASRSWMIVLLVALGLATSMGPAEDYWRRHMAPLPGTDLGGKPAAGFRLNDHRGVSIGLEDFRGRPLVLAFLFTECPDVCRLTAAGLRQTIDRLGSSADAVGFAAISVDPRGDGPAAVRRFLGRHGLADRLLYLTGPPEALPEVWSNYYLYVSPEPAVRAANAPDAHTDALFVIDKAGRERVLLHSDFDPDDLTTILRRLIAEPA